MSDLQPLIVGTIMAQFASADLLDGAGQDGPQPHLRLKGLEPAEIVHTARNLLALQEKAGQECALKIAEREVWEGCPPEWFLAPGETRAEYRNKCPTALVLIDHQPEPDEQSLRNMHALSDSAILDGWDDLSRARRARVVDLVYAEQVGEQGEGAPASLSKICDELFETYQNVNDEVSLRAWVGFLIELVGPLAEAGDVVDESEVKEAVTHALPALNMFPDPELFERRPAGVRRRLVQNIYFGALRSETGKEVGEDELERRIESTRFRDGDGGLLPDAANQEVQQLCRDFVLRDREIRRQIPFSTWAQLFDKTSQKRGLGQVIREHVEERYSDRLEELEALEVVEPLDQGDTQAAETLLKEEPDDPEERPLADLLTKKHRRAVEKLANPSSPYTDDPLNTLLLALHGQLAADGSYDGRGGEGSDGPEEAVALHLDVEGASAESGQLSLVVFRFLYGSVLADLAELENPGRPIDFSVADPLIVGPRNFVVEHKRLFPPDAEDDGDSERALAAQWAPLRLVLRRDGQPAQRFTWRPDYDAGRVALARMACEPDDWHRYLDTHVPCDKWLERASDPAKSMMPVAEVPEELPAYLDDWLQDRRASLASWAEHGLSVDRLTEYVDRWQVAVERVRTELVPHGSRLALLDFFLDLDTAQLGGGRWLMLASHPLRARWIASYLAEARDSISAMLLGTFRINSGAEDFYFSRRTGLSPHRQPPVMCTGHGALSISARELGWNEEFARIETSDGPSGDWTSALDETSVDEMAQVAESYLQAHPHKETGLSILFVSGDGEASHVERLVKRIMKARVTAPPTLRVYVIAPALAHDEIARVLERLDDTPRTSDRLLPRLQTFLLSDDLISDPTGAGLSMRIDLALVPNIFGKKTTVLPQSRRSPRLSGAFNVLLHPTSYDLEAGDENAGENVSRALLPESEDFLLESWSTMAVRRKTESTVTHGGDDLTDLFALRVRFTESLDLFKRLHEWSHWVVTLDPFVGREQIEALESRPDVITVKPHVGKNGNYTLVVSSSAGRDFVVTRLARKLESDLGVAEGSAARSLATSIYENGRSFAPGVVLRALGLGRTSHELVGLLVSRWVVVEEFPPTGSEEREFEAWLSLDEHARWFGSLNAQRADLLRVVGTRADGRLQLSLQVVEAKFRKDVHVGTADSQVRRTMELLPFVFAGACQEADETAPVDAAYWRKELVDALQQSASRTQEGAIFTGLHTESAASDSRSPRGLPARVRQEILDGDYDVVEARGIVCSVAHGVNVEDERVKRRDSGFQWIRVGRSDLGQILGRFGEGKAPSPRTTVPKAADVEIEPGPASLVAEGRAEMTAEKRGADGSGEVGEVVAADSDGAADEAEAPEPGGLGLGGEELRRRYRRMLDVFSEFDVSVRKPDDGQLFVEGPAFYQARVVPGSGVRTDAVMSQVNELKLKLGLPAELEIRAFVDKGAVTFQVPKADEERYFVEAHDLWEKAPPNTTELAVPVGEDIDGNAVSVAFSSPDSPHLLIGGTTGSGKSVAMEVILHGMCRFYSPKMLRLQLVDPKGTELVEFENDPHVDGEIGAFAEDAIEILDKAVGEMQARYRKLKAARCRSLVEYNQQVESQDRIPWHVIVLDEYADLTADKADRVQIETNLKRLAQKARASGIHLIVATQKPSAEILSTSIRSNLPAQLCLRVKTGTDSRMIMDETGGETLAGKGDAFFKTARRLLRIQCAWVDPEVLAAQRVIWSEEGE